MQVSLRVVGGKNDGRQIKIAVPKFIIGRGETAHLRPASDLVSREHCAIKISDGEVTIQDLNSRNGTFVNGEKLTAPHKAKSGDALRVGRLHFEIMLDMAQAGVKKPKVSNVVEAASRAATTKKKQSLEDSISDWLTDDDEEMESSERRIISAAETLQFNIEETSVFGSGKEARDAKRAKESQEKEDSSEGKKGPKKLPKLPTQQHDDSISS